MQWQILITNRIDLKLDSIPQYPKISLCEERRLISKSQKGSAKNTDELILRHLNFVLYRICKKSFPAYAKRFGEDLFTEVIFILYDKIRSYDLKYKDKKGNLKPVRFSSYIWKRIDGFILDSLKAELRRDQRHLCPDWERFE